MFKVFYLLKLRRLDLFSENACIAVDVVLKYWLSLLQVDIHEMFLIGVCHLVDIVLHGAMLNERVYFLRHILKSLRIR